MSANSCITSTACIGIRERNPNLGDTFVDHFVRYCKREICLQVF